MGRYGQAILTIAGTIVGSYFGYPALGAALGSLAGSLLFPTQLPTVSGPRLADLTQTTASVGTSIPRGVGTFSVGGTVIYQSNLREVIVSEEVGGKGGAEQTVETPTYYQDFAISLCEGEDPITNLEAIAGVRRIWANGKCIYDRRPQDVGESDGAFNMRIAASDTLDAAMVIYRGTEDQMPDPTIEADKGVGNVSAFRGLAYVMFINWQNKPEDGNKMPLNWKFEVYTSGATAEDDNFEYSNHSLAPWFKGQDIPLYADSSFYNFTVRATGWPYATGRALAPGTWNDLSSAQSAADAVALRSARLFNGYSITPNSGGIRPRGVTNFTPDQEYRTVAAYDAASINLHFNVIHSNRYGRGGDSLAEMMALGLAPGVNVHTNGYFIASSGNANPAYAGVYQWWPDDYWSGAAYRNSSVNIDHAISTGRSSNPGAVLITGDMVINVTRNLLPPGDQCAAELPNMPAYCISTRGNLVRKGAWEYTEVGTYKVLQQYGTRDVSLPGESSAHDVRVVRYPLNPCLPSTDANYNNQAYWEAQYAQALAQGLMLSGLVYNVNYPVVQTWAYRREIGHITITTNPVPLREVITIYMREAGYPDADFDVSEIPLDVTVTGFVRTRVMSGRSTLEPLRQAKFFDGIESNGKVKFLMRGRAVAASLTDDDLGFHVVGEDAPSRLTTTTADETTLPRSVRVHYLAQSRDYEPGEQSSPPRVGTRATNDVDIELPMVLTDDEAAQIAEVLWAEAWTSRKTHQAVIDGGKQELEPTDAIEVPVDGIYRRVRILSIEDAFPALRRLELVRDDDGSYVSRAVGTTPGYTRPSLTVPTPAELVLLDLPALRDEDDDAGVYAAVRPYLTDVSFHGATVLRSTDGGASYTSLGPIGTAVPMGLVATPVPAALHTIWDEDTVITVQMQYGELESRTEADVLAGANAAAIGDHTRWEIIQFRDAEFLGDGVWNLSGLLRGRRGTEHNIGTSVALDRFVMLSTGGLVRLALNVSEIGLSRLYKCVAVGTRFGDAEPQEFTGYGEALHPFSPVHIEAVLEDDGDIAITWIRRGRLGQTLQSGTDIPLSEATEAYEVDIVIDGAVVRTYERTEQSLTYSAIDQGEDFDSPPPASIDVRVYQISATVGRGHVGELELVLADLDLDGGGVDVPPDELASPDADALIVPLVYDEVDEAVAPLTWTRQGDGPRITDTGFIGDGVEARLRATASLPAYATSSSGALYLRATIKPYDSGARAAADRVVSLCVNDATANPRLEFAIVDDANAANEPQVAVRSYTGSMQTKQLSRRQWRFTYTHPEKSRGGFNARPRGFLFNSGANLLAEHYEGNFSTCHQVNAFTGEPMGFFQFGGSYTDVSAIADRVSDGAIWFSDETTQHILEIDLAASLSSQAAVVLADVDLSALTSVSAIDWVVIEDAEYLLVGEAASGLIYVFDAVDVVNGAVLAAADRVMRLQGPANLTGIAYQDGSLYVATTGSGAIVHQIDFDTWFTTGSDDESYAGYELATHGAPSSMVQDMDFDAAGNLWMVTDGNAAANDDTDWFAVWQSPLDGQSVANVFAAYYSGGTVTVRVNDRPFCTLAWTPTPTPGAVSIGGPPQAAASQTAGFFIGEVRDVLIQGTDYNPEDFGLAITYEGDGNVVGQVLTIENPSASDFTTTGWTSEVGALATSVNLGHNGVPGFFLGGNEAHTLASQILDLSTMVDFDEARLDDGDCWAIVKWYGSSFASQSDNEAVGLRFLDAAQVAIGADNMAPHLNTPGSEWTARSYGVTIPSGTRYIAVLMDMVRVAGTQNDGYIDDISATIYIPVPQE